jgi:hypothetical protein
MMMNYFRIYSQREKIIFHWHNYRWRTFNNSLITKSVQIHCCAGHFVAQHVVGKGFLLYTMTALH